MIPTIRNIRITCREEVNMNKAFVSASIALALCFSCGLNSWAAGIAVDPPHGNWNKVLSLEKGANVTVLLKGGVRYVGTFVSLGENSIIVNDGVREREFPKSSVLQIGLNHPGSRARNAAIAGGVVGAIGFGIGCAVAARALDKETASGGERMAIGGAMGGVWGGIAAAIAAAHKPGMREEKIYQSK
jgi:hypothetical protein